MQVLKSRIKVPTATIMFLPPLGVHVTELSSLKRLCDIECCHIWQIIKYKGEHAFLCSCNMVWILNPKVQATCNITVSDYNAVSEMKWWCSLSSDWHSCLLNCIPSGETCCRILLNEGLVDCRGLWAVESWRVGNLKYLSWWPNAWHCEGSEGGRLAVPLNIKRHYLS